MSIKLTWYGHACFLIDTGDTKVLTDPFLTGNPLAPVSANEVQADFILVSHGHGDHLGDTVEIAKRTGWSYTYVEGGSVQGLLQTVAAGKSDLAAADISITAEREKRFDFSQPIIAAGLQIIVPADTTERVQPGLVDFVKLLFSNTMGVWLLAALALTVVPAHVIWVMED